MVIYRWVLAGLVVSLVSSWGAEATPAVTPLNLSQGEPPNAESTTQRRASATAPQLCVFEETGAIIWRASSGGLTLDQLAQCPAPALWYSPDEPLPVSALPQPLPGDRGISVFQLIMTMSRPVRRRCPGRAE